MFKSNSLSFDISHNRTTRITLNAHLVSKPPCFYFDTLSVDKQSLSYGIGVGRKRIGGKV